MESLNGIEKKCLADALAMIKANADKYSLRLDMNDTYGSDRSNAANVLLGNIAFDKYKACVATASKPRHH